jgi:hypothetical protein
MNAPIESSLAGELGSLELDRQTIGNMAREVAEAIRAVGVVPPNPDDKATTRIDYQITVDMIKKLMEIRFQCLTFMTAITAAAFALLSKDAEDATRIVVGLLGMCATLGIAIYELRNSQIYDAAIHRAKFLEKELNLLRSTGGRDACESFDVGLFGERPAYVDARIYEDYDAKKFRAEAAGEKIVYKKLFRVLSIKHDHGLALIYAAVFGSWSYLAIEAMLTIFCTQSSWIVPGYRWLNQLSALLAALALSFTLWREFVDHDRTRLKRPTGN